MERWDGGLGARRFMYLFFFLKGNGDEGGGGEGGVVRRWSFFPLGKFLSRKPTSPLPFGNWEDDIPSFILVGYAKSFDCCSVCNLCILAIV